MKFSINKEDILEELQLLQGIVEKRNTLPILANILINVTKEKVEMTGTDLEVGLKSHFPAKIDQTGAVTVSGKKLFEIVKSLAEEKEVTFKENQDSMMEITAGESEFRILCLPKEDYPQVPEPRFEKNIILPLGIVKEMVDRVYYAITQEHRYYLTGALLILKNKSIELVSTDGHRLAYTAKPVDDLKLDEEIRVIVAKKTLSELRKIEDEEVEFDFDQSNLFFRVKNRTLISRIIEGKFPNFEEVIPVGNPQVVVVPREEITNAIRRVSLLSSERSRGIKFFLEKNRIRLFSSNPEIGEARDKLDVKYDGEHVEVGFNAQYLLDFLSVVQTDSIQFELKDENSAVLMRPEGEEDLKFTYVLMPMKI
ncbi:MAG: DNA polymerase III subunit beta [Candidatus Aminicenantes bacterium]|nr:DNA polymerase III subunit beta [Candidatus Aminicenantes bacterium]